MRVPKAEGAGIATNFASPSPAPPRRPHGSQREPMKIDPGDRGPRHAVLARWGEAEPGEMVRMHARRPGGTA